MNKLIKLAKIFLLINFYLLHLNTTSASSLDSSNNIANIELVGTITGKNPLAILRIKNKSEEIYQLNQTILGFTIKSISSKNVLLTQNDELTTLSLIAVKHRHYYGANTNSIQNAPIIIHEYRINRTTFNSLHNDTQSWLNNVQLKMHIDNGYFSGYEITDIQKNSPAELLGIAEGDIIIGINDTLIKQNPHKFIKIFGQLTNIDQFTLNMRHKNAKFNLKFLIHD